MSLRRIFSDTNEKRAPLLSGIFASLQKRSSHRRDASPSAAKRKILFPNSPLLRGISILLIFWFALHALIIIVDGLTDNIEKADVAVVFGSKVNRSGTPSRSLRSRLQTAIRLYREGKVPKILVSGGPGKEGFEEAEVMARYLIRHGVPAGNILQDRKGNSTLATARNSILLKKRMGWRRAILVTHYYHIARARLAFRRLGWREGVFTARGKLYASLRDLYYIPREFFAYYYYLLRPIRAPDSPQTNRSEHPPEDRSPPPYFRHGG